MSLQWIESIKVRVSSECDSQLRAVAQTADGHYVIRDYSNRSVKIINKSTGEILSRLSMPGCPWDLCFVHENRLVVSLPFENKLQYLELNKNILTRKTAKDVDGEVRGLCYHENKLMVSFTKPPKLEIMTLDGKVLTRISANSNTGQPMFNRPFYVAISTDGIFVSDCGQDCILQLSHSGELVRVLRSSWFTGPLGLSAVDAHRLLVCGGSSDNIVTLNTRDGKFDVLHQLICGPYFALCSDPDRKVVIGRNADCLEVYEIQDKMA